MKATDFLYIMTKYYLQHGVVMATVLELSLAVSELRANWSQCNI